MEHELGADDCLSESLDPRLRRQGVDLSLEPSRLARELADTRRRLHEAEKMARDLRDVVLPLGTALSLTDTGDCDRIVEQTLIQAKALCGADGGTLYMRTEDEHLAFAIMHNDSMRMTLGGSTGRAVTIPPLPLFDAGTGEPNHRNVATHVAHVRHSVNLPDIYHAEGFDFSGARAFDSTHGYRSVSSLTVPLLDNEGKAIAVLQLLNAQDPDSGQVVPFSAYLQEVVECLASQAAVSLSNQLLLERQQELLKTERDLQIGRRIQKDFVPAVLARPDGWEIAAECQPARTVGGDFYDVYLLQEDLVAFVIADVCDKGVGAALFMALMRSLMRAYTMKPKLFANPAAVFSCTASDCPLAASERAAADYLNVSVAFTNDYIVENHSQLNMFATLFFGVVEADTGLLRYVNGGHEPPLVLGRDGVKARLKPTGPAVGTFPGIQYPFSRFQLEPGDTLLCFTDGVVDARDPGGASFHLGRLQAVAQRHCSSAWAMMEGIKAEVHAFMHGTSQFDDITMLAVRRPG
ncbi:MAG: SpoIIE family protein phosphatase [Candidatus Latescibacterota bacterium]